MTGVSIAASSLPVALDVSAIPPRPAGAGRYVLELAGHLAAHPDTDVTLICQRRDATRWAQAARGAAIRAVVPRSRPLRLAAEQLASQRWVTGAPLWHGPHYSLPLGYRRGPRVVSVHDLSLLDHPEWHERSKTLYFGRMIPAALRVADAVYCESHLTGDALVSRFGIDPAALFVAPLGIDPVTFHATAQPEDPAAAAGFGLTPGRYVLALGTTEPRKNLARLVRAFDRVAGTDPQLLLAVVGQEGWKNADVGAALAASPHAHRIRTLGYVDDALLPALLRQATALAYPSLYEGFGLPVIEALACGTLVVTSLDTVMTETTQGVSILVDPTSDDAVADGLAQALAMTGEDRNDCVARGIARAGTFRWSALTDAHLAAYEYATHAWRRKHRPR